MQDANSPSSNSTPIPKRLRNPTNRNGVTVSTWGYSNILTTPTVLPSGRWTSRQNKSGGTRTACSLAQRARSCQLPRTTAEGGPSPRRHQAKASGLPPQTFDVVRQELRSRSGRKVGREGVDGTPVELAQPFECGMGDVPNSVTLSMVCLVTALAAYSEHRRSGDVDSLRREHPKVALLVRDID